jgi:hypothetical protein
VDHIAQRLCIPARRRYAGSPERQILETERNRLLDELRDLDRELAAIATRRAEIRDDADAIRDALWPREPWWHARRPNAQGATRLAPVCASARQLWGIHLRATCIAILERHGTQTLPDLHSLLHIYGYRIGGRQPVKDLADAMRHEVNCGRAVRVARGKYRARHESGEPPPALVERWPSPAERWPGPAERSTSPSEGATEPEDAGRPDEMSEVAPSQASHGDDLGQPEGTSRPNPADRHAYFDRVNGDFRRVASHYDTEPDLVLEAIEREVTGKVRHARYMRGRSPRNRSP